MDVTRCKCMLADCVYFHSVAAGTTSDCDCSHPDKPHYMANPCPLYKKEWLNKQNEDKMAEIKARMLNKRKQA